MFLKFFKCTSPSQCPPVFHILNMQKDMAGVTVSPVTTFCIFKVGFNLFRTNAPLSPRILILVLACTLCTHCSPSHCRPGQLHSFSPLAKKALYPCLNLSFPSPSAWNQGSTSLGQNNHTFVYCSQLPKISTDLICLRCPVTCTFFPKQKSNFFSQLP